MREYVKNLEEEKAELLLKLKKLEFKVGILQEKDDSTTTKFIENLHCIQTAS